MSFTLAQPNSGRVWKCNCERPARSQLVTPASQQPKPADTCLIRSVVPCELDWFSKSRRRRVQVPALALSNNASLCKSSYVQMYQSPRSSSSLQAGNFVGLMGQILQQLTATVPQGAALTVDSVRYHPAGIHNIPLKCLMVACLCKPDRVFCLC